MNNWKIYMYIFPNGKRYIGKTKRTLNKRKVNANWEGYKNCSLLWKAIQKYGTENIEERILFKGEMTDEESERLEKMCILLFKTNAKRFTNPIYGYNLTDGGDGNPISKPSEEEYNRRVEQMREQGKKHKGVPLTEDHKRKLSEAKKGENHWIYGKHLSEEAKRKISIANSRENMSEETRRKRSESKKKKVIVVNIKTKEEIIFSSVTEASEYFKVGDSTISR